MLANARRCHGQPVSSASAVDGGGSKGAVMQWRDAAVKGGKKTRCVSRWEERITACKKKKQNVDVHSVICEYRT